MNALQIKIFLLERGLTITDIAKALSKDYDATVDSIRTMLTDLFYHGKWNSKLAKLVRVKYGIKIEKSARPQTVREAVRRAA
jgi:hypothetical protein